MPDSRWSHGEGYGQFSRVFENPASRTDGLTIYPTLVIRGTGLSELWKTGKYKNYCPEQLVSSGKSVGVGATMDSYTPHQRDVTMPLVTSGVEKGNLRELALARMVDLGLKCR